jgi:hypothetical protein
MSASRDDMLPLHRAISGFHFHGNAERALEVIQLMVTNGGADVNAVDSSGNALLHRALLAFSASTIEAVIARVCQFGLNVNIRNIQGETALHVEIKMMRSASIGVVKGLVDAGANVNLPDSDGRSPLILALCLAHRIGLNDDASSSSPYHHKPGTAHLTPAKLRLQSSSSIMSQMVTTSGLSSPSRSMSGVWSGGSYWLDIVSLLSSSGARWWGPSSAPMREATPRSRKKGIHSPLITVADQAPFRDRSHRTPLHLLMAVIPTLARTHNNGDQSSHDQYASLLAFTLQALNEMKRGRQEYESGLGVAFGSPTSAWGWDWTDGKSC